MTLRDWFAGQALPAIISICVRDTLEPDQTKSQMFAEKAYRVADAMIAARQGGAS